MAVVQTSSDKAHIVASGGGANTITIVEAPIDDNASVVTVSDTAEVVTVDETVGC